MIEPFNTSLTRCLAPLLACLTALPSCAQEETPFTRLFDTVVTSAQPLADETVAKRVGWTLVPEDKVDHPFTGDAVLLNDKLAVVFRKQGHGAEVYSRAASGFKHRASVGDVGVGAAMTVGRSAGLQPASDVLDLQSRLQTGAPNTLKIVENNSSAVMVQAMAKEKASAALSFRLTTGEAILEIRSGDGTDSIVLQSKSRYVVVPDYFGDDMVFPVAQAFQPAGSGDFRVPRTNGGLESPPNPQPGKAALQAKASSGPGWEDFYLPAENFCLHLLDGGDAIVMSVWQSSEQDVWLAAASAGQPDDLCFSQIRCLKGKSIWLAFLESPGLWHAGGASTKDDWKPPFPAKWRCSLVRENGVADSWITEKPDGANPERSADFSPLPPGQSTVKRTEVRVPNAPLLIYPIDRSAATPLTVTCPTDVMRNTLGVGPCQYILACEGLAAQGDPTPNAVMNWVEKQFEAKKERKAADDIKERLDQMTKHVAETRARIERYGEFAGQVRKQLAEKKGAEPFRPIVDDLDRFVATGLTASSSAERAQALAAEVASLIGKENALAACQALGGQLRSIGSVQDSTLARCRMAARCLRQQGRTSVVNQSPEAGLAREIQQSAEQILQRK